jgi:hypothetical protein
VPTGRMEGVPTTPYGGLRYFLSVTLPASFLAAICGTFPTKAEPTVDSYRIFLVKARHNRCSEQGVTEDGRERGGRRSRAAWSAMGGLLCWKNEVTEILSNEYYEN